MVKCDCSGWATKANLLCSDGRVIMKDAFKHDDGQRVPLVWNHQHNAVHNVLGHAILENKDEGVYAYCFFNNSESGIAAKSAVENGDIRALSIYANKLKQQGNNVVHGTIREVSLVLAGANPGAFIDSIIVHGEDSNEEAIIYTGEDIVLSHGDDNSSDEFEEILEDETIEEDAEETENEENDEISHAEEKTIREILKGLTDEEKLAVSYVIGAIGEETEDEEDEDTKGGNTDMKHNVFDKEDQQKDLVLSHSDQAKIIGMAKQSNVGTLQTAISMFMEDQQLAHAEGTMYGDGVIEQLFPDYKDLRPGAPELLENDLTWVGHVMRGTHKSPISRIRTRQADVRNIEELRAKGYKKGAKKELPGNMKLMSRTTDPQTIYRIDTMHRDDIIDITEFDVVAYQWNIMRHNLEEEIARAILIGDGREDGDEMKIDETHIRSIWNDDDLYTIHADVDIAATRKEIQGTDTGMYFGDNYVYAEAIVTAALYSREKYKGSGALEFYCTPHLLNVMLLSRDRNGHRMYSSKADLAAALNVTAIHTVEQFEGKTRKAKDGSEKKLLGIFVNLKDYVIGSTRGGEITKFDQFDIDFNQYKYLIETRISGALSRVYSAIVLEEPVGGAQQPEDPEIGE